jgi:hypothetical protein
MYSEVPQDGVAIDEAIAQLRGQHATLRSVATLATREGLSTDTILSLADAVKVHELDEAVLFETPLLTGTPKLVRTTAERVRRHCSDYTAGGHGMVSREASAARFVDALLAHIAAEEAWLERECEHRREHMMTIA